MSNLEPTSVVDNGSQKRVPTLRVVSLSTHDNAVVQNFEKTALYFGYEYYFVGRNKKFQGWPWRTSLYKDAMNKLSKYDDDIFVLCDSNDLFFVAPSDEMRDKFVQTGLAVLIGAEAACCNGHYSDRTERIKALSACQNRLPWTRNRFPNGGFLIGTKTGLLKLMDANKHETDDQGGYLQKFMDNSDLFDIDAKQQIVGNLPTINMWYHVPGDEYGRPEITYWQFDKDKARWKSTITGEYPCALHFPGQSWEPYNAVCEKIFPYIPNLSADPDKLQPHTISLPYDRTPSKRLLKRGLLKEATSGHNRNTTLAAVIVLMIFMTVVVIVFVIVVLYFVDKRRNLALSGRRQLSSST